MLADLLGLAKGDFAAVGDGVNDIPVLRKASLAVGVGDHPQVRREAAFSFPTGKDALAFLLSRLD